jgi:hypothetical protein
MFACEATPLLGPMHQKHLRVALQDCLERLRHPSVPTVGTASVSVQHGQQLLKLSAANGHGGAPGKGATPATGAPDVAAR